jgi:hypothetical protein
MKENNNARRAPDPQAGERHIPEKSVINPAAMPSQGLERFGFNPTGGGVHTARTMMFAELGLLFSAVPAVDASKAEYRAAVVDRNCLGKRSITNRRLTMSHLATLYGLDSSLVVFRALRSLWERDPAGRPVLALECAFARDPLLRKAAPFILERPLASVVTRDEVEEHLEELYPGRFSRVTRETVAQDIDATLTDSKHLVGKAVKKRSKAVATVGTAAYALLLGYLEGARGAGLFETDYARLLDVSKERIIELATDASAHGWIVFKHISDVYDVSFPSVLTAQEMGWIRGQD